MEFVDNQELNNENIFTAASDGDLEAVREFIEKQNLSPNSQDEYGYSPLHAAASYGHVDVIKYLVEVKKANIHIRDQDGDTPLLYVEEPEIFELLVNLGANKNDRNSNNEGIVEKAVEDENDVLFEFLVSIGMITDEEKIASIRRKFETAEICLDMDMIPEGEEGEDNDEMVGDNEENPEEA